MQERPLTFGSNVVGSPQRSVELGPEETVWIERAARGDAQAVAALYRLHQASVRAFAQRLTGDHASAEDLVQDVFMTLPALLRSFRGRSSLRTFLLGSAANHCRKHIRSATRRRNLAQRAGTRRDITQQSPESQVERMRQAEALSSALDRLPVRQRLAFVLVAVEQRSHIEAAAVLKVPEATVRTRCFHARKKLRRLLREVWP